MICWFWALAMQWVLHKLAALWLVTYFYIFQVQYKGSFMLSLESIFNVMCVQRWSSWQLCSDSSLWCYFSLKINRDVLAKLWHEIKYLKLEIFCVKWLQRVLVYDLKHNFSVNKPNRGKGFKNRSLLMFNFLVTVQLRQSKNRVRFLVLRVRKREASQIKI